jgi:NAD(P)H-hydrate epimerase
VAHSTQNAIGRAIVTPHRMAAVDARTIERGVPAARLMERAGTAIARVLRGRWSARPVAVLAGPGQNGGDGWVVARLLREAGWPISVYSDWPAASLNGAAKAMAERWDRAPQPLDAFKPTGGELVVDALFGAGLSRPLEGSVAAVLERTARSDAPVIAADLPSGLDGGTGETRGPVAPADATVTFGCPKPGHFLGDGPALCGRLHVVPIGLQVEPGDAAALWNAPGLWREALPFPPTAKHKYDRGAVLVFGGPRHAGGASRLTAMAAARAGAGATTIAAQGSALDIYAAQLDAVMLRRCDTAAEAGKLAESDKIAAIAIGPGLGTDEAAAGLVRAVLAAGKPAVIDADALTLIGRHGLLGELPKACVLTPHEGEFRTLFPEVEGSALDRATGAVDRCGRTVLLKGATTVIASPDELPVLNTHSSPWLATAGSGDVLTGLIAALLAQGVDAHLAAAAGAWIHGEAGRLGAVGLTADDLPGLLPPATRSAMADAGSR